MTSSCFWVWVVLNIPEIITVLPRFWFRIKGVQIIETERMRSTSSKQEKLVIHVTKLHACSWSWALANHCNLRPNKLFKMENKKVIEPLWAIPTSENIQIVLNNARAMICSWRGSQPADVLHTPPMVSGSVKLMQVIEIVSTITSSENINLIFVAISSMHVARTWWFSCKLIIHPFEVLKIQHMHVICSEWTLSKPPSNNVESVL